MCQSPCETSQRNGTLLPRCPPNLGGSSCQRQARDLHGLGAPPDGGSGGRHCPWNGQGLGKGALLTVLTPSLHPHLASPGPGRGAQMHKHFLSTSTMCSHKHTEASPIPEEETEASPWPGLKGAEPAPNANLPPPAPELCRPCCSAPSTRTFLRQGNMWESGACPEPPCPAVEFLQPFFPPFPSIQSKA